jgi:biotin carboxyl carrier protein
LLDGVLEIAQAPAAAPASNISLGDLLGSRLWWIWTALVAATGFIAALAFTKRGSSPRSEENAAEADIAAPRRQAASILSVAIALAAVLALAPGAMAASPDHEHGSEGEALIGIDVARRLPDGSVFMPKPAQWLLGVRTTMTEVSEAARTVEMLGTVVPDPSASGRVQASLAGRVEVANGHLPHVGQTVAQGEVLAILSPTVPVFDRGTTDAQIAEIAGAIEIAEQKVKRHAGLTGIVPQKEIDQVNAELVALKARRAALRPVGGPETLKAPVSGIVAAANVHLGQVVDARETLFEIVDPDKLWIEAIGTELQDVQAILSAKAFASGAAVTLSFIGRAPALKQQAQPLLFRVERSGRALAVGRPVAVLAQLKQQHSGVVVPGSAVVRAGNGLPQVWELVSAERFEAIAVRTAPLDGKNVLITAGVKEGTRLVVEGAEFVNQVR